ncbi:MAG: ferredoxin [Candidatus Nanohaloarchaeota archaeon QJJ-9]|nr:ferredoxin [Candidatus Nanohaloarchaeota archaeon QJJ-9]
MKKGITVDEKECIGCRSCVSIVPELFEMEDGKAKVKEDLQLDEEALEKAKEAAEFCPTDAISIQED